MSGGGGLADTVQSALVRSFHPAQVELKHLNMKLK